MGHVVRVRVYRSSAASTLPALTSRLEAVATKLSGTEGAVQSELNLEGPTFFDVLSKAFTDKKGFEC